MSDSVIDNIIRSQTVEDYLDFFENKDLESISNLFSDTCSLRDWNLGLVIGKDSVMKVFSNIFQSEDDVGVKILHMHEDIGGIIVCEMVLTLGDEEILVADVFEFDEDDLIQNLRAYRGN